jgi:uncharacterized protein involved in exopolysaccharide biosynthesis
MGYKALGFVVWQGAKWYLRRRFPNAQRNLAIAGVGGLLLAAVAAGATRQRSSD